MREKNYTNLEDKGRFGFSASGKFNTPYKLEVLIISVAVAAAVVALILTVFTVRGFVKSNVTGVDGGLLIESLAGGVVVIVVSIAVIVSALLVIKFVVEGFTCTYIADEEKFTAEIGGTHRSVYYKEVQTVHFQPRTFMGTVHGYNVTVKVNGANEEFAIVSSGYISEKTTPFYIIKERMELIRNEEERTRGLRETLPSNAPLKPISHEEQPLSDKVAALLGKDAEMPGVSAAAVQKAVTADPDSMPETVGRVSPTVNGYADDMPAVGADGRVIRQAPIYTELDGRERSLNDIVAQGTFRETIKPGKAFIIAVIAIVVYVCLSLLILNLLSDFGLISPRDVGEVVMVIVAPFYGGTIINYLRNGDLYHYRANGREFVISCKGKADEHIYYNDVQDVTYTKSEFLWFINGYKVEILTRHGVLRYNYIFPGFGRKQPTSNLPFEVIRERIQKQ